MGRRFLTLLACKLQPGNAVSQSLEELYQTSHLYGSNASLIEGYYESWLEDESSVPAQWAMAFSDLRNGSDPETGHLRIQEHFRQMGRMPAMPATDHKASDHRQAGVLSLINAFRTRGHENANINPLGVAHHDPVPDLELGGHDLSESDLDRSFDTGSLAYESGRMKLRDILALCRKVYCGSIGVEYMHILDTTKRHWLQERLEGCGGDFGLSPDEKIGTLKRLTAAEGLEKYLHTRYVGQKRFSLEGGESLIPLLHQAIRHAGRQDIREVVVGMAHRGRLNVLVNILGKSPAQLFQEFEGKAASDDPARSGDVKYHLGYSSDTATPGGMVHVAMAFNPSHLEIVDPVVVGSARARQDRRDDRAHDEVMPVLIHGDAAFAGQGVIMELFQMSETRGFAVGGTLHIIVNNQIGFTTSNPEDTRSTLYSTPIAKMVHAPIFHVNADDPEAVRHVMKIALDFRKAFKRDVVIDLVCYRRLGHNEADEPAATQPLMYRIIRNMESTRQVYAKRLTEEGVIDTATARQMVEDYREKLDRGEQVADVEESPPINESSVDWSPFFGQQWTESVDTAVPAERLRELSGRLTTLPDGFELQPRVGRIIADRQKMAAGELRLDWGFAETAAYASLISEGYGLRLVGQDSGRGTFFHRHAVLHNQPDGVTHLGLAQLNQEADVTVIDSLLSEEAVLGFEYGYACSRPNSLVIWEAQFGDFVNGAQVVIDQFITSGETKWGRLCGLVMFLPHGYEGQGPEHSSARLERFMQLCSHNNIQVCVPTTPGQMFHMLRRQMLRSYRKPLIVMTPKSLLRSKASSSTIDELSNGQFQLVIDDPAEPDPDKISRLVFCSGKIY
jgi:2-oxoglutarate dehydrogenase E1 component